MKYFNGFSLANEQELFNNYIIQSDFCVAGFSYGAQKAFEYVIHSDKRVDTLQLFSPAFFNTSNEKFIRLQLIHYNKNRESYTNNFMKNTIYPSNHDISSYLIDNKIEDLTKLLSYKWDSNKIKTLLDSGIKIEVYIGEKDKIIDPQATSEFFTPYADIYWLNECGHILKK